MASTSALAFDRSSWTLVLFVVFAALITYILWGILYQFYYDPLARYHGPRLAAFTNYWRLYVDIVQQKSFVHELEELHDKYGTACPHQAIHGLQFSVGDVVRIGPREVRLSEAYIPY